MKYLLLLNSKKLTKLDKYKNIKKNYSLEYQTPIVMIYSLSQTRYRVSYMVLRKGLIT